MGNVDLISLALLMGRVEGLDCTVVKSSDFVDMGDLAFKVLLPTNFCVKSIEVDIVHDSVVYMDIFNADGVSALEGPIAILWDSDLVGSDKMYIPENSSEYSGYFPICFNNCKNIPKVVDIPTLVRLYSAVNHVEGLKLVAEELKELALKYSTVTIEKDVEIIRSKVDFDLCVHLIPFNSTRPDSNPDFSTESSPESSTESSQEFRLTVIKSRF